jgi:cellulose synthase/poly-beta-1,6-N-acetylglucosamine synthase-like glycosyltransferase
MSAVAQAVVPSPLRQAGQRLFEASPGLITWIVLLSPALISFIFASDGAYWVAIGILVFDVYWFGRSFIVIWGVHQTYFRMRRAERRDWLADCHLAESEPHPLDFHHLCVIPTYTEPYSVLEATVQAIVDSDYPKDLKIVAIITREEDKPGWRNVARLRAKFGSRVGRFYHIKDPLEPGIVIGKSAAMNYGGRWLVAQLRSEGMDLRRVLLTDLDSDYRVHPRYFAWISYHHALYALRDSVIWQPIPLFHNNIWSVPSAIRVMSSSISQWQMYLHSRPHRLVAFSSYCCSLQFVEDVGYWDKDVIPEDSRFYWKAFFTFGERFAVRSCYLPLFGDSPKSRDYASTHMSQYNQIKRWAWGITDVPYVLARFLQHPEIPLGLRLARFLNLFLNHLNWVFLPLLLLFGASIPVWVSVDFSITDLGQTLWLYTSMILTATLVAVISLIFLEQRMLPPKPADWPIWKRALTTLQYCSYPVVGVVLSVIPALEAHTRLLLGKYLEYRVTEKG